jgi:hypothetical protein
MRVDFNHFLPYFSKMTIFEENSIREYVRSQPLIKSEDLCGVLQGLYDLTSDVDTPLGQARTKIDYQGILYEFMRVLYALSSGTKAVYPCVNYLTRLQRRLVNLFTAQHLREWFKGSEKPQIIFV